ncbi:MAG: hypothetical protein Q9163_001454 [Psora crenata]
MPKRSREESPFEYLPSPVSPVADSKTPEPVDTTVHSAKYSHISTVGITRAVMKCSLPPHDETLTFETFEDFEIHYAKSHTHRCSDCRRNFPTEHFLDLHISENHDPLNQAKRARGDKTNYDFLIVNTGTDKRSSMLRTRHRKSSSAAVQAFEPRQQPNSTSKAERQGSIRASEGYSDASSPSESSSPPKKVVADVDVDGLTSTMSSLKFRTMYVTKSLRLHPFFTFRTRASTNHTAIRHILFASLLTSGRSNHMPSGSLFHLPRWGKLEGKVGNDLRYFMSRKPEVQEAEVGQSIMVPGLYVTWWV